MSEPQPAYSYLHSGEGRYVNAVAAHPGQPQLVTAGDDGRVVCWDAAREVALWEATLSEGGLFDASYDSSGEHLIVAGAAKAGIKCLRARDGKQVWSIQRRGRSLWGFTAAAVDPRGRVLVAAPGDDSFVHLYALPKRSHELNLFQAALRVVFSPDGKRVATAGEGSVKIWNPHGKRRGSSKLYLPPTWLLPCEGAVATDVAFAPGGSTCATVSTDGVLRVWPVERRQGQGAPQRELALEGAHSVAYSPDGRWLAVGHESGLVTWLSPESLQVLAAHPAHETRVCRACFTPGSAWLLSAGADGKACLWAPPA